MAGHFQVTIYQEQKGKLICRASASALEAEHWIVWG